VRKLWLASCATVIVTLQVPAVGQQPTAPEKPPAVAKPAPPAPGPVPSPLVPLRVRFVLSKYQGEKKLSSLPYDLSVNGGGNSTQLRIGGDVPYRATNAKATDDKMAIPYNFRTIGTSIDCSAVAADSGSFRLVITVSDDSISYSDDKTPEGLSGIPRFRTFRVTNTLLLRDGQTTQMTTATDPITGEVMRVDVTLNVLK
jgi:type II/III secretion system protein